MQHENKITSYQLCRGTANGQDFETYMERFLEAGFQPYGNLISCGDYIIQPVVFGDYLREKWMDKYDDMEESLINPEWELIKPDSYRLTKDEEMSVMRIMKRKGWEQVNIRITREGDVMVSEDKR